eukprot:TRINITY_DN44810_c0_g1_i1.p1 TRINITY_DN44810_c0_g1~~TRINITY_DN44810_c0_g1_i1.p1  ORF type:complete len:361 (+),score=57.38 TRINITY_DN44810_c0_g1_i1:80-1162(+)
MSLGPGKQSALNRLRKAASLGFGPLAPEREKEAVPTASINATSGPLEVQGNQGLLSQELGIRRDEQKWKACPDFRLIQSLESADDYDFAGVLAGPKQRLSAGRPAVTTPPPPSQKHSSTSSGSLKMTMQTLNISTHLVNRSGVASTPLHRPDEVVDSTPPEGDGGGQNADQTGFGERGVGQFVSGTSLQRGHIEQPTKTSDVESDRVADGSGGHDSVSARLEEVQDNIRLHKKEVRKKREQWRRQRKEEQRREAEAKPGGRKEKERPDEIGLAAKDDPKARAQLWRVLNNDGHVYPKNLGQISDRDLDKRLESHNQKTAVQGEEFTKSKKAARSKSRTAEHGRDRRKRSRSRSRDRGRRR